MPVAQAKPTVPSDDQRWRIVETRMREESEIERRSQGLPTAEERAKSIPLRRAGLPADIAKAVAFLASEEADYITGETVMVTGGMWND